MLVPCCCYLSGCGWLVPGLFGAVQCAVLRGVIVFPKAGACEVHHAHALTRN